MHPTPSARTSQPGKTPGDGRHPVKGGDGGAAEIKRLRLALADCEATLKTIHTWATFRSGEALRDRWSVAKLCKLVLDSLHNVNVLAPAGEKTPTTKTDV